MVVDESTGRPLLRRIHCRGRHRSAHPGFRLVDRSDETLLSSRTNEATVGSRILCLSAALCCCGIRFLRGTHWFSGPVLVGGLWAFALGLAENRGRDPFPSFSLPSPRADSWDLGGLPTL